MLNLVRIWHKIIEIFPILDTTCGTQSVGVAQPERREPFWLPFGDLIESRSQLVIYNVNRKLVRLQHPINLHVWIFEVGHDIMQ